MALGPVVIITKSAAKAVACTTGSIAENEKTDLWLSNDGSQLSNDGSQHRKDRPLQFQRPSSSVIGVATTHTLVVLHLPGAATIYALIVLQSPGAAWHLLFELSGAFIPSSAPSGLTVSCIGTVKKSKKIADGL